MDCIDCCWSARNSAESADRVCCNKESPRYNEIMAKETAMHTGCEKGETQQAVDYRCLNPWEFARKYYM